MATPNLHADAFLYYIRCPTIADMGNHRFYFREWRKFRGLTQGQVVARLEAFDDPLLPTTEASLSRIETGKQPYSQRILEALADVYQVEPHQLIGHNPEKEGELIDLWSHLTARQRQQAVAVLEALRQA